MFVEIVIFLVSFLLIYFIYNYKRLHSYFESREVKYSPGVPIFGNVFKSTFLKRHYVEDIDAVYKAFPDEKYVGFIEFTSPVILVRDPDIIKDITVKDFDHFVDHKEFLTADSDPLLGGSLFSMKGGKWHDMRMTLSPAFTSSKMRLMMPFMTEISNNIIEYLKDNESQVIDVEDLMHRYTSDVIASAGFGLQVNSMKDRDNEFFKTGNNLFNFNFRQKFYMFLMALSINLCKKLNLQVFPEKTCNFFRKIVSDTMDYRIKNKVERPDMIQLLLDSPKDWTARELTGQVFLFFAAGFETSASVLVMCVHELALNEEIQEKLYQEIRSFQDNHSSLTNENLTELKYLDCVVNETLRKWSPAIFMDRTCVKPYELPPPRKGARPYSVKPGDIVYNMVNTLHMDPKYFPDPESFDPERFSDENKHKIKPYTFMPFGNGPRVCLGTRFAYLEVKILLFHLLKDLRILKCEKTECPMRLAPHSFNIKAENGTYVKFQRRN